MAEAVARKLGITGHAPGELYLGVILHDVGKIAIDPTIQNKPSKQTDEEYPQIMTHTHIGPGIVEPVANQEIRDIIRHHHDYYSSRISGQIVQGDEIPLGPE